MSSLEHLLERNRVWARRIRQRQPQFFAELASEQHPQYLWIGCSDSRVSASDVVDLMPGELFVHRNIANVVVHTDLNCLSVLEYAVEVIGVRHIIVCGHYGCGGVRAALGHGEHGLMDNWLRHIKDVYRAHRDELKALDGEQARIDRLCELNVAAQVYNVCHTTVVQNAWSRGQQLTVHGWIYGLTDGLIKDLGLSATSAADLEPIYRMELGL